MRAIHVVLLSLIAGFLGGAVGGVVADRYLPMSGSGEDVEPTIATEAEAPKPSPPIDPSQGILKLETLPWSVVFLDGEELGDTPLEVNLPAGVHRLRFLPERTGSEIFREIDVKGGETTRVKLTLLEKTDAEPRTPPPASDQPAPLKPPPPPSEEPVVVH